MLEILFGSKNAEKVLQYLLNRDSGYIREIANFYETSPSVIKKQLDKFELAGIIVGKDFANTRIYELNKRYPLYNELTALLKKALLSYDDEFRIKLIKKDRSRPRANNKPLDDLKTLEEIASYICTKLKENGIDVVLSGGSCMEIYTHKNFSSYDIDFIANPSNSSKKIEAVMISLGFKKIDGRYYKYDNNPNYIEFPTGPVSLGNDLTKEFSELKTHVGNLTLLTPTDCIKDRLCALVYHGGEECWVKVIDGELKELEVYPPLINDGVISIMIAHITIQNNEKYQTNGLPSSCSRKIVTGLLKEELGFKGLIITDALNIMKAVTIIKNAAFASNQLLSVTIPANVTSIGEGAFLNNLISSVK